MYILYTRIIKWYSLCKISKNKWLGDVKDRMYGINNFCYFYLLVWLYVCAHITQTILWNEV